MNILLDTHTLLWFIEGDSKLPVYSIKLIKNINNKCFISVASIWEIAINFSLGKLDLIGGLDNIITLMSRNKFELLPISFEHIQKLIKLDYHHRDPFDRMIIAQSLVEKLPVITKDKIFSNYDINTIWIK
ncbi:MAG: type II toxin-antitoxin system VapC family toxin [Candidatus Kapabacteria bacterium]|nr:type II toxin-antitoxin system VapC family toxin [Candidatus Kapabacteria bacterium]